MPEFMSHFRTTLTKISHNISYMKISYMKSLYGIETNFIYEIFHI